MIKLKNLEAVGFTSPILAKLFNDTDRTFPMEDAFKLADAVEVIRQRLTPFYAEQKKVIEKHNGKIEQDGRVVYPDYESQSKATEEINSLGLIELEYPLEKITPNGNWPNLTLTEASILSPILGRNGDGSK